MSKSNNLILVGLPNSGKTTLFNWLTGYTKQTVNYPGTTMEISSGEVCKKLSQKSFTIIDTPGVYNFFSSSTESKITKDILKKSITEGELKGIILVLDATRLKKQASLILQLQQTKLPFMVALSMYDLQKKQSAYNLKLLSKKWGVPVIPIEGLLGGGVPQLLKIINKTFKQLYLSTEVPFLSASKKLETKQQILINKIKKNIETSLIHKSKIQIRRKTQLLDSWLLHPVFGFVFLGIILFTFFSGIFWLSHPLMDFIDSSFSWGVQKVLNLGKDILILDFLANGVLTSFGSFFIFVPQVFILFFGIHLLEDSGYLARAVALVDGFFSRIGLSGKSLLPFLSGFACAIPATLAARSISSKRERWITIFVLPLITCSARLPVYVLLLSFLFYKESIWKPGLVMAFLYFLSLFLSILGAGILNLFIKKNKTASCFIIELPIYHIPVLYNILKSSWLKTKHFIVNAGPIIFVFALIMWGVTHFPRYPNLPPSQQIEKSYAGQFGKIIEPAFQKMGGDWRVGVSLLSAFVAREVFVSVLAVSLKNTNAKNTSNTNLSLLQTMKSTKTSTGKLLFSTPSVLALLVFFIFSLQCLSTTGIVYRETGSWRWAIAQLVSYNVLAYALAVFTYFIYQ